LEVGRVVNEKQCVIDSVFLPEFSEEYFGKCRRGCGKQPDVKQFVCLGVGGGVQPVLLVVDANHGLVNRNLIRSFLTIGL
jgi:hypothetical protein